MASIEEMGGALAPRWEVSIGFACAHDLGFRACVRELVVLPSNLGRGIGGQRVWRAVLPILDREQGPRAWLEHQLSWQFSHAARHFRSFAHQCAA
jgi:hypothetical protein